MDLAAWAARESRARLAPLESRWAHACGVAIRAREIAEALDAEHRPVLIAVAYLHDIGYAPELVVHDFHPLDGALWLEGAGERRLAGLVAHHTAARFEAKAHGLTAALGAFDDEQSAVSDALAYCDLTTGPTGQRVSVVERLEEIERRYGSKSPVVRALEDASETLRAMVRRTETRLADHRIRTSVVVEGTAWTVKTSSMRPATR